ncbi:hypothetical protein [Nostoc sp.]
MGSGEWGVGSGEEAFSGCTDFFQKSNTSPILDLIYYPCRVLI